MALNPQFTCWTDETGDIWVSPGTVVCMADRSVHQLAAAAATPPRPTRHGMAGRPFATSPGAGTLLGGSGNNASATPSIANTIVPAGLFRPAATDVWGGYLFPGATITLNPDGSAEISDGTDVVASVAAGSCTIAPYGTFAATTYGKDTYNLGTAFDIEVAYEGGGSFPAAVVTTTAGTMQAGTYSATDPQSYTSDDDPNFTLAIASDGSATISDASDVIATRPAGLASPTDPRGTYLVTDYGRATYHSGLDFSVVVWRQPVLPIEGVVYFQVTESSPGIIGNIAGPYLAASLPADAAPVFYLPIAQVTASGPVQILEGTITWGASNACAFPTLTVGDGTNQAAFDSTGHLTFEGTAKPWDDLRIEPVARGANAPTFEKWFDDAPGTSSGVWLYSFDDATAGSEKEIFFSMQMPHSWDGGSIEMHLHFVGAVSDTAAAPRWGLEYAWKNISETFGDTTTIYSDGKNYTTSGDDADIAAGKHYIAKFAAIDPGSTASEISSIMLGRLFRDSANAGDTYNATGAKCGLLFIDAHFQIARLGSSEEYTP